jgi:phosphohistidine phosphatase SixA
MNRTRRAAALVALIGPLYVLLSAGPFTSAAHAADNNPAALIKALQAGGHVILLRHATTEPGIGDPSGYRLEDCKSQRNLSAAGRQEAKQLGEWLRARKVPIGDVRSSLWCRCLDTARLAFGKAAAWAPLNSFFDQQGMREPATAAARQQLRSMKPGADNAVWVTHQVNITALTGVTPAMGEMVVVKVDGAEQPAVLGRIRVGD